MIADMPGRLVSPITVGRGDELQVATRALTAALEGHPVHLLIAGEAGVGKTRFVAEIAATAAELGMRVVSGGCANIGQGGLPYGALVEALRGVAADLDPARAGGRRRPRGRRPCPARAGHRATVRDRPDTDPALEPWQQAPPDGVPPRVPWPPCRGRTRPAGDRGRPLGRSGDPRDPHVPGAQPADRAGAGRHDLPRGRAPSAASPAPVAGGARADRPRRAHRPRPPRRAGDWRARSRRSSASEPTPGLVGSIHRRSDGNPFFAEELLAASGDGDGRRRSSSLQEVLIARVAGRLGTGPARARGDRGGRADPPTTSASRSCRPCRRRT